MLWSISDTNAGWAQTPITTANSPNAPAGPILAAANVDQRNQAYVVTATTFHVLSLPGKQWVESGPLNSRFPGLPGQEVQAAQGVSWPGDTSDITFVVGDFAYIYHVDNTSGTVTADAQNPKQVDWSSDPQAPDRSQIKTRWLDLYNAHDWLQGNPNELCGANATSIGPNSESIVNSGTLYAKDVGPCFKTFAVMPLGSFAPFTVSPRPAASDVVAGFYMSQSGTLYIITAP